MGYLLFDMMAEYTTQRSLEKFDFIVINLVLIIDRAQSS